MTDEKESTFVGLARDERRGRKVLHRNTGIVALGGLLILAGLAILLGFTPESANEAFKDKVASGLIILGVPLVGYGNVPAALTAIRAFIPFLNRRGKEEK